MVRQGDILHSYADIEEARRGLGFEPKVSPKEGFHRLLELEKPFRAGDLVSTEKVSRVAEEKHK